MSAELVSHQLFHYWNARLTFTTRKLIKLGDSCFDSAWLNYLKWFEWDPLTTLGFCILGSNVAILRNFILTINVKCYIIKKFQLKEISVVRNWITSKAVVLSCRTESFIFRKYPKKTQLKKSFFTADWVFGTTVFYWNDSIKAVLLEIFQLFSEHCRKNYFLVE